MTSKFLRLVLAVAAVLVISAIAQTSSASTPAAGSAAPATPSAAASGSTKIGTINIEQAIVATNEGRRDFEELAKKLEPKRTQLTGQNDELEGLKKQLTTQGDKLSEDALANLRKQIETKQKALERAGQDFQEEAGNQQNDIAQRILQKMAPMIVKYAQENAFGMIVDTSKPWPQSPVLWADVEKVDITKPVVDVYNAQSNVPAPTAGTAKPPAPKPATGASTTPKAPAPKPADPAK
ncbi:MAG TPA: OmpH family outer membrane protein [Candidatus Sulfotelmatobacter sp.]|nr:OmpH family outer membrane protein [Candidatus Sulfotelmatobacter sp.]